MCMLFLELRQMYKLHNISIVHIDELYCKFWGKFWHLTPPSQQKSDFEWKFRCVSSWKKKGEVPCATKLRKQNSGLRLADLRDFARSDQCRASPYFSRRNSTILIPITMNLSDVKTQSPPESGLPSAVYRDDHKSHSIYNRISYIVVAIVHTAVCNTDVKELDGLTARKRVKPAETKKTKESERETEREEKQIRANRGK